MKYHRFWAPLALAFATAMAVLAPVGAQAQGISQKVGVCNPLWIKQCEAPNVAGGVPTGAVQSQVTATPTVTAASAYASGNSVGGLQTFAGAVLTNGNGTGLLQKVVINYKSLQTAQTDLLIFNANPSGTTVTDKTAFSLATADFSKLIGVVHVTDCTALGTPSVCMAGNLALPVKTATGTSLFGVLVTRGTPTFTATTDVSVTLQILQD